MLPWVVSAVKLGASELIRSDMIAPRESEFLRMNYRLYKNMMSAGQTTLQADKPES
jgi:hypothetical protein